MFHLLRNLKSLATSPASAYFQNISGVPPLANVTTQHTIILLIPYYPIVQPLSNAIHLSHVPSLFRLSTWYGIFVNFQQPGHRDRLHEPNSIYANFWTATSQVAIYDQDPLPLPACRDGSTDLFTVGPSSSSYRYSKGSGDFDPLHLGPHSVSPSTRGIMLQHH